MAYDLIKISALPETTPDESQEIVVGVGDYAKRINYGDVKADMVGTSPSYTTDTEPYLMRQTAHTGVVGKCALNKLVGGSLGWNQLITIASSSKSTTANNVTITDNRDGSYSVSTTSAGASANTYITLPAIPVILDHKYLVKGTPPNGSSSTYYGYITGTGIVEAKNDYGSGCIVKALSSGNANVVPIMVRASAKITTTIKFYPNVYDLTQMFGSTIADYVYGLESATAGSGIAWLSRYIDLGTYHAYDAGSIQSVQATAHVTTGFNQWDEAWELGTILDTNGQNSAATNRIRSTNYIPIFADSSYYIKSPKDVKLYWYDGNKNFISASSGWTRNAIFNPNPSAKYMRFILETSYGTTYANDICINISKTTGNPKNGDYVPYNGHTYPLGSDTLRGIPQLVSNKLAFNGDEKYPDGTIRRKYGSRAYQSGDASDGATMITDGTTTVYKLATPTTESSTSYQKVQTIDADGTESFTTSTPVPVGHETQTPDNILAALGWLGE